MSGRAGRRGKDPCGTCIIIANEELEEETCRDITTGECMCTVWV
jgi:superfamily II RNA helicase